jgi:hypothetical protein
LNLLLRLLLDVFEGAHDLSQGLVGRTFGGVNPNLRFFTQDVEQV